MATEHTHLLPKSRVDTERPQNFPLLILGVWSLIFISSIDQTIVATLISNIGSSLESMQLSSWIGTAYLLSFCGFTPIYGRLANIFGRRASVLFAGLVFSLGTLLCGFATSMSQLVGFRALAGIGGGMTVVGSIIVSDSVPLRSRALHQGLAGLLFALGGAMGGPIGGWLGDTIGWRAAFIGQVPLLLGGLFLLYREIREPEVVTASRHSFGAKLKRVDWGGSATLVLALLTFLLGMHFKSTAGYDWENPRVWGLLTASGVVAVSFVVIELYVAAEPVMPLRLLKLRTPGCANLNMFLLSVLNFSIIYNVPLYFTAARLRSSTDAGVHLIPLSVTIAVGSVFTGWYMRWTGRYWWLQTLSCLGSVTTCLILVLWDMDTPEWILYTSLIPFGIGFSATTITTILSLISSLPPAEVAVATGMFFLARVMGQVFGVSLSAALTQGLLARNLRATIVGPGSEEIIERILDSTEFMHTLPLDIRQKAATSWFSALHIVFICQIALATMCFLSALPIEENDLPDVAAAKRDANARMANSDEESCQTQTQ